MTPVACLVLRQVQIGEPLMLLQGSGTAHPQSTASGMNFSTGVMAQQATTSTDWMRLLKRCSAVLKGTAALKMTCSSSWLIWPLPL